MRRRATGGALVTIDLDATIVIAHSEKEEAAPTWKKTFGFHPLTAFADHGAGGNGEPLAIMLRAGGAGSNTAADHIEASRLALAQLPRHLRRKVLIRADSGGGTHGFLQWLTAKSRRLHYSVGMTVTEDMQDTVLKVPADSWTPAYDGDGQVRDGAWVADITGMLDLSSWPAGMRVIVRKERPHPGAQLRFTDIEGHRFTAFVTDTKRGQLADLELRHRRRARCEDRILPRRQGHRATQPAPQGLRPKPAVVRDHRPGLRAPSLDPDARPDRHRPPLGARTAPAAPVLRRRAPRPRRAPPGAQTRRTLALGRPDHPRRHPPASHPLRLTSRNHPCDTEGATPRARGTPPPARQPDSQPRPAPENQHQPKQLRPARQARETSRLVS
jgi:Transposase DDE domain group 1